jgi:hypothetical protein
MFRGPFWPWLKTPALPGSNLQAALSIKATIPGSLSIGEFNAAIKL